MIDRIFISGMLSVAAVGLYNIGYQISSILFIVATAINTAYAPWFIEQISIRNKSSINTVAITFVIIYSVIAVFLSLYSREIIYLLSSSPDYYSAWNLTPFLILSFFFNSLYYLFVNVFFVKRTKFLPILTFISFLLSCSLNYVGIKYFGLIGSAMAAFFVKLIFMVIVYISAQKVIRIDYNIIKIISISIITIVFSFSSYFFNKYPSFYFTLFKFLAFLLFVFIIYIANKNEVLFATSHLKTIVRCLVKGKN